MLHVTVRGGTNAGCKIGKRSAARSAWTCSHGHVNQPFAVTCLTSGCRDRRPKDA